MKFIWVVSEPTYGRAPPLPFQAARGDTLRFRGPRMMDSGCVLTSQGWSAAKAIHF